MEPLVVDSKNLFYTSRYVSGYVGSKLELQTLGPSRKSEIKLYEFLSFVALTAKTGMTYIRNFFKPDPYWQLLTISDLERPILRVELFLSYSGCTH